MSTPTLTAAKQKALEIKHLQEETLANLHPNHLYIFLWIRNDPPRTNDFHWGFYLHTHAQGGVKYHIRNIGDGWIPDHGQTGEVLKTMYLCVLIEVANVPETMYGVLDDTMRSLDGNLNAISGMTCRVWVLIVVKRLIELGVIRCESEEVFQEECMMFGNMFSAQAAENLQPRPVVRAQFCIENVDL